MLQSFARTNIFAERMSEATDMYFRNFDEFKAMQPVKNGIWNKEILKEYLIQSCNRNFKEFIDEFMADYQKDEMLADLLFEFLLNDDYDGSDSQMGAARYIGKMDKALLRSKKDLLIQAQKNEVHWKRPFPHGERLEWL